MLAYPKKLTVPVSSTCATAVARGWGEFCCRLAVLVISVVGTGTLHSSGQAGELLPPETPIFEVIDHYIDQKLSDQSLTPAAGIDDESFQRRVTLDLAGRIPTVQERLDFLSLPTDSRRSTLIDNLLQASDFAFHQRNELDLFLLARRRKDDEWRKYLLSATKENRSWSQLFREIIVPELEAPGETGATGFIRDRVNELDDLTNDTAVLFFGVNIGCAKCHDHPLVDDWEQRHYFGMASFFKRTYVTKSRTLAEDFQGEVKFTTVAGEEKQAEFMFLSSVTVHEPMVNLEDERRKELSELVKKAKQDDNAAPPEVSFHPRQELVSLALHDDTQSFLARNIVNRVWARLTGYGLVMPLDQMHSANPPSHPELLDWLARDLVSRDYDLRHLIDGIVRTRMYARGCRANDEKDPPRADSFAVGRVRPLTPRQLSLSLTMASFSPERLPGLERPEDWETQRQQFEDRSNGFADLVQIPDENFQISTEEALLFSNSKRFEGDFLGAGGDRLIGHLKTLATPDEITTTAFHSILSRDPSDEERQSIIAFLDQRNDRRDDALKHVVWALLTSPEFRFNH